MQGGLGFRDMKAFNRALLAKHAWRILDNITSFVERFFKGMYYRHGDFLGAVAGSNSSYV